MVDLHLKQLKSNEQDFVRFNIFVFRGPAAIFTSMTKIGLRSVRKTSASTAFMVFIFLN